MPNSNPVIAEDGYPSSAARYGGRLAENMVQAMANAPDATSLAGLLTEAPAIPIPPGTPWGPVSETALERMARWNDTQIDLRHSSIYASLTREEALAWIASYHASAGTENSENINGPRAFYTAWRLSAGYSVLESCFMASRRLHEHDSTLPNNCFIYAPLDGPIPGATATSEVAQAVESEETESEEEEPDYIGENEEGDSITQEDADAGGGRGYTWSERQECYIRDRDSCTCSDTDDAMSRNYRRNNAHYVSATDQWYWSEDAAAEAESDASGDADLFDYSENVMSHFPKNWARDALVFGVELEMEGGGASASDVVRALGGKEGDRFILKEDGSLDDSGVELVTVPMSLADHRKYWSGILTERLHAVAHSGEGTSRCGMHVHINRGAVSPLTLGKMLVMANSEDATMVRLMETVAQRKMSSWAKRSTKKLTDGKRPESDDRYEIINISGRYPTAEVRMFRGNLRAERVIKNLEFCHALVTYCRDTSIQVIEDAPAFARWLVKNRHYYPALVKFLADNGVVELPTLTLTAPPSSDDAPASEEI